MRRELGRVWLLVSTTMDAWSEQAAVFIDEIRRLGKELTEFKERCKSLDAENKDLKRRLSIHENYNNPDRSTLTAKKRKKHRKKEKEMQRAPEQFL